jgi:methionyl-tRNA formyltransferase
MPSYLKGEIKLKEQNHKEATSTKILTKEDGFLNLAKAKPEEAERFIRAMDPWPGAWTQLRSSSFAGQARRLKILKGHLEKGKLVLDQVQLESKNPVSWKQFTEAYPNSSLS